MMRISLRNAATGEPIEVECHDLGVKRFKGKPYYTSRFVIPGRNRAIISRVIADTDVVHRQENILDYRLAADRQALELIGITF